MTILTLNAMYGITSLIVTPGSMKMRLVHPSNDTPTDTVTDLENFEYLRESWLADSCFFPGFWSWHRGDHFED